MYTVQIGKFAIRMPQEIGLAIRLSWLSGIVLILEFPVGKGVKFPRLPKVEEALRYNQDEFVQ
jgi:hypothetical protein